MKTKQIFFIALLFLASCSPKISVKNINSAQEFTPNNIIYYLPETVLKINIEIKTTSFAKGPYFQFAEKYLGIQTVETEDFTKYEISNITIDSYAEPDYNNVYLINIGKKSPIEKIQLTSNGLLSSINTVQAIKQDDGIRTISFLNKNIDIPTITNLTVKKNLNETEDTIYKKVKHDSITIKVPVIKKQFEKKSLNEKAEEAANYIIKIRKNRFKLIAGNTQLNTDGMAVKKMIDELNKLEQNYLSLFIGQKLTETVNYNYDYTPNSSQEINNGVLFYFSEIKGISPKPASGYEQITIKILKCGKTNVIESYNAKKSEKVITDNIFYRIPDCGIVNIQKNNNVLASRKVLIAQFGTISNLPNKIFNRKNVKIEFDSNLGSIRKIY